jgi:hypothetical protein
MYSCSTSDGGSQEGCKNNGLAAQCYNKLTVFDWLSNELPTGQAPFDCVEVRFKTEEKFLSY